MEERLIVAVDGSECSLRAVDVAVNLARATEGEVVLCHVIDAAKAARLSFGNPALLDGCYDALRADGAYYLDQALQRTRLAKAEPPTTVLAYGNPCEEIESVVTQKNGTMIVMGTQGRTGLAHLLMGSVAEGVLRHADVPVVVVPP